MLSNAIFKPSNMWALANALSRSNCVPVSYTHLKCQAGLFDNTPELVKKLNDAFEDIEGWLLTLATPAAAVAVGVGVFMKKFSFGDEERIRISKKLIRGSLFSYGFILAINLILYAIQSLID